MSWLRHALERTQISFDGQADVGLGFLEDALPELPDVYGPPERRRLEEAFFKLELLMEQKEAGKPLALPASLHRATLEDVLDAWNEAGSEHFSVMWCDEHRDDKCADKSRRDGLVVDGCMKLFRAVCPTAFGNIQYCPGGKG